MITQKSGFTLIELMITVAIIGILAAIAVPYLRGYTLRAKIAEALVVADLLKSVLGEAFVDEGSKGIITFATRVNGTDQGKIVTNKISKVHVCAVPADPECDPATEFGHITITLGGIKELPTSENEIAFSPHIMNNTISATNAFGVLQWVCAGSSGVRAKSLYSSATLGTMSDHNIPDECR